MSLRIILFSTERFPARKKAGELLELFHNLGGVLAPIRYDEYEPVRKRFDVSDLSEPANLLCGYERVPSGWIYLRGQDDGTLSWIRWSEETSIMPWYISVSDKTLKNAKVYENIIELVGGLVSHFDIVFGGVASEEYWNTCYDKTGDSVGVQPLPGIFPLTVFGKALVEHFSRKKFEILKKNKIYEWAESIGILISQDLQASYDSLSDTVCRVRNALGDDYFFDIESPQREYSLVSQLVSEPKIPPPEELSPKESFVYTTVRSPEGDEYTDPQELVGVLTTYLYDVVPEVSGYTRDSLNAIDAYFVEHSPELEFNQEFLLSEFIPALGAHLGETLVRSFDGVWNVKTPMLSSGVNINSETVEVFKCAYEVVYEERKFVEIYDACSK